MIEIINTIIVKIGVVITSMVLVVAGLFTPTPQLGATIPTPVALFETSLQASITSSDTSMTLISTSTEDGTNLTNGTVYGFIVDEGTASEEFVLGTASSSKIISMTRGVSVITGNTNIASLQEAHRRGASVKITSAPVLLVLSRIINGDETIPNVLSYTATTTPTGDTNLVHKYYVDASIAGGGSPADTGTAGISIFSTQAELAAGTATSSYAGITYNLFPQNKYFNATQSATTTVPVTGTDGKLSQSFLDLTESFTISGTTTISGAFTSSGATIFSSSVDFSTAIPTIPTSAPTSDDEVASKKYVDDSLNPYFFVTTTDVTGITAQGSGGTNEETLATTTITGGTMGANDILKLTAHFLKNGTDPVTMRVKLGGTTFFTATTTTPNDQIKGVITAYIINNGSTSVQISEGALSMVGGGESSGGSYPTSTIATGVAGTISTASNQNLLITKQFTSSGQNSAFDLLFYLIEILKP